MDFQQLIQNRKSANSFQPGKCIDREVLNKLIAQANLAPSCYNLCNWRFVIVDEEPLKEALKNSAYKQEKITQSSATIVVMGDLLAYQTVDKLWQPLSDNGFVPAERPAQVLKAATGGYENNRANQEMEAYRSGSLAAMQLLLALENEGLAACPMGGFEKDKVLEVLNLSPDKYLPIMLITVGYAPEGENIPQKPRPTLENILVYNKESEFKAI